MFVFIGAEIDSYAVCGSVGMPAGKISNHVKGQEAQLYAATASAKKRRSALNREHGVQVASEAAFFADAEEVAIGCGARIGCPSFSAAYGGDATFHRQQPIPAGATPKVSRPKRRTCDPARRI
jgi:hypothetical protein